MTSPQPSPHTPVQVEPDHQASSSYLFDLLTKQIEAAALREGAVQALHKAKAAVEVELEAARLAIVQLRGELEQARLPRPSRAGENVLPDLE